MAYLVGVDEAGYGPNLGPLVIAATVWRTPSVGAEAAADLATRLQPFVVDAETAADDREHLAIADSKALYRPGRGLAQLERGVLATLGALGRTPRRWSQLWPALAPSLADSAEPSSAPQPNGEEAGDAQHAGIAATLAQIPWYRDYDRPLPQEVSEATVEALARGLQKACAQGGITLQDLRTAVVFPSQLNRLTDHLGSKGAALSHCTLTLVRQALSGCSESDVLVHCDKHGGRNRYAALLQHFFPDDRLQVVEESRPQSAYQLQSGERCCSFRFVAKGDRFLPAALASMACKYARERAMEAFNAFWKERVPGLRPTAGYPTDAKRFRAEIQSEQHALGVEESTLWRAR